MTRNDKAHLIRLLMEEINELEESLKLEMETYDPENRSDKWINFYEERIADSKRLMNELKGEL